MNIEETNYEQDTSIDEDALDLEWLEQPRLMMKYTRLEAQAQQAYEKAKEQLDIIEAELYQKICNNPDEFDLPKTTETAIQGAIKMTERWQQASEKVTQAKYEYNMASAAVRSLYGKKEALENLVRLHGQQYFAGPSVPRDMSREWEKGMKQKRSNQKVKIGRSKKPKRTNK